MKIKMEYFGIGDMSPVGKEMFRQLGYEVPVISVSNKRESIIIRLTNQQAWNMEKSRRGLDREQYSFFSFNMELMKGKRAFEEGGIT